MANWKDEIKHVTTINGGYLVAFADGTADAICAYQGAEDAAEEAAAEAGIPLRNLHMVCGWDAADDLLRRWSN